MKRGLFSVRDRENARSDLWKAYQQIVDQNGEVTNIVQCRQCKRFDKYESEKGVKNLSDHAKNCSALGHSRMDAFIERNQIEVTKDEKKTLAERAAEFCYKDMRPFTAISGTGLMQLLLTISALSAKYGKFSEEQLKKILPCANTVSL